MISYNMEVDHVTRSAAASSHTPAAAAAPPMIETDEQTDKI